MKVLSAFLFIPYPKKMQVLHDLFSGAHFIDTFRDPMLSFFHRFGGKNG